ncbi:D-lactate dehydrogenase [Saccharomycopsis crataegensis]|uniref:D-lactate dehydrogenase (cytochrome) n=1 Tax=Saccharomycopsis crataegensis TaxID=43959 RepID=A0AAV5QIG1_9ASCO|nr:D-lactate dehydrogenase [Saccharomycopsis crataegensis]
MIAKNPMLRSGIRSLSGSIKRSIRYNSSSSSSSFSRSNGLPLSIFALSSVVLFSGGLYLGQSYKQSQFTKSPPDDLFPLTSITPLNVLESPTYGSPQDYQKAFDEITAVLGENFVTKADQVRKDHSDTYWNSHHATPDQKPFAVVYPNSTEQVSQIMKICFKYRIPVIPFSGGTSLEGHFIPTRGGISIDVSNMNNILAVHKQDLDAVVQPGVPWEDLGEYLADQNLMFGPDPGPSAQIGGMIANSCSGTNASRYGTMKDNVLSLTVVLADGTIIKTRKRPKKSSAGYNLTNLFIGSEGTLGIVTEATLKLHVKPEHESIAVVSYDTIEDAANTVEDITSAGIQVNAVELLDDKMMKYINKGGQTSKEWKEKPTLFFKLGGTENGVKEMISRVESLAKKNHSVSFEFAKDEEEKYELWQARKVALWSTIDYGKSIDKDAQVWTTDVAVPVSKLAKVLTETKDDMNKSGLLATLVGHVGDGNFHAFLLYTEKNRHIAETLVDRMVKRALDNDGTCTGEHGVGYGKREFLIEEVGEDTVSLMRKLKMALDPLRILNTDKVIHIDPNEISH